MKNLNIVRQLWTIFETIEELIPDLNQNQVVKISFSTSMNDPSSLVSKPPVTWLTLAFWVNKPLGLWELRYWASS